MTKALTAIDPDNPELAAARAAGIPLEPWQQVVADAAVGRTLVGVAGTHGKSTTVGLARPPAGRRRRGSVGVRRGAAAGVDLTGGPPATARWGQGDAFVVEADEYAGNFDAYHPDAGRPDQRGVGPPGRVRRRGRRSSTAFEAWLRREPDGATLVANVGDPGVEAVLDRLARLAGVDRRVCARGPGAAAAGRLRRAAIGERFATAAGPATAAARPDHGAATRRSTTLEVHGLDPLAGAVTTRLSTAGRHNAANALAVAGAAAAPRRRARRRSRRASPRSRGVGRRLERKGEAAGVVVYDDYGHHPTAIRETLAAVRQREPGRPRLGRLRAADLPPDGGDARRLRRCPGRRGRGRDRRHLGRPRPRHDHRLGGRTWPRRSRPGRRA